MQFLSENYPLQDIVDSLSISLLNYDRTLLLLPADYLSTPIYQSTVLEVRLSLALHRLVYVWTPYQWQQFTLLNYRILDCRCEARLSLRQGDQVIESTCYPNDPRILLGPY
jgi:hypothetical protein